MSASDGGERSESETTWRQARFMLTAVLASFRSKDRSAGVGAVFTDAGESTILSAGYNGFPKTRGGAFGDPEIAFKMYKPSFLEGGAAGSADGGGDGDEWAVLNKNKYIIHAEVNALLNMASDAFAAGLVCFVTLVPCPACVRRLVAAGVSRVYYLCERGKYVYDDAVHGAARSRGLAIDPLGAAARALLLDVLGVDDDGLASALFGDKAAPVGRATSWVRTIAAFAHAMAVGHGGPAAVLVDANYAIVGAGVADASGPLGHSAIEAAVFRRPTSAGVALFVTELPSADDVLLLAQYGVENIFFSCPMPSVTRFPPQRTVRPPDVHFQPTWTLFRHAQAAAPLPPADTDVERDVMMKISDVFGLKLQFVYWDEADAPEGGVDAIHRARIRSVLATRICAAPDT